MFEGFKDKMNQIYDNMKNRIQRNEENPNQINRPPSLSNQRPVLPVIQRPNKPNTSMNNSLVNSFNESDLDMRRLDNFQLNWSSQRSFEVEGARRVAYYDRKDESRNMIRKGIVD
jgi:hypothetical protein